MTTELSIMERDALIGGYSQLTKAKELLRAVDATPYVVRGEAEAIAKQIELLQTKMVSVLISGDLPLQPAPVIQRNYIGQKKD